MYGFPVDGDSPARGRGLLTAPGQASVQVRPDADTKNRVAGSRLSGPGPMIRAASRRCVSRFTAAPNPRRGRRPRPGRARVNRAAWIGWDEGSLPAGRWPVVRAVVVGWNGCGKGPRKDAKSWTDPWTAQSRSARSGGGAFCRVWPGLPVSHPGRPGRLCLVGGFRLAAYGCWGPPPSVLSAVGGGCVILSYG
jgi:hypothetical protein